MLVQEPLSTQVNLHRPISVIMLVQAVRNREEAAVASEALEANVENLLHHVVPEDVAGAT